MSTRAQAFSLEAFVASILLVATLAFALQAVAVSSNTAGAADAELRSQHAGIADGVLAGAAENGTLQATVVYWDESTERFYGVDTEEEVYVSTHPNTTFGETLGELLGDRRVRYNVDLYYREADGQQGKKRLVEYGTPSHEAVRVTETVTLYDDTPLVAQNETRRTNATLETVEGSFYAPDAAAGPVYNVIRVEVVLWRV
jgi:hypothetical protein